MSADVRFATATSDPVSNVLMWILLAVAVITFGMMTLATVVTYDRAPPQPDRFMTVSGRTIMTNEDILDGKAGFQKADLMDYGSIYGMGSYYGEDYTANTLVRLGTVTKEQIAKSRFGRAYGNLSPDDQASVAAQMQRQLQGVNLTKPRLSVSDALAAAIGALQKEISASLSVARPAEGRTPAYSLTPT